MNVPFWGECECTVHGDGMMYPSGRCHVLFLSPPAVCMADRRRRRRRRRRGRRRGKKEALSEAPSERS